MTVIRIPGLVTAASGVQPATVSLIRHDDPAFGHRVDMDVDVSNQLAIGNETFSREIITSSGITQPTGVMRLAYFTARRDLLSANVRTLTGATAAGATPSLYRVALFVVNADGSLTLAAVTANTPALMAVANLAYQTPWTAPYQLTKGIRYAVGVLCVTAFTTGQIVGMTLGNAATEMGVAPFMCGSISSLADIPATVAAAGVTPSVSRIYAVVLP